MKILLLLCLLGQMGTGAIVSYQVDVYDVNVDPSMVSALFTMTMPAGAVLCNVLPLPPPKTLTQFNPQAVYWNDVVNAGKVCKLTVPLLGTLPTRTDGLTYVLTVTPVDDLGRLGQKSNTSSPFNNTAPIGLTGVAVR